MKNLAPLALVLLFPVLAPADDLSAITARLDRLERENVELRGKLEAVILRRWARIRARQEMTACLAGASFQEGSPRE